jgi:hypothetical protein
VASYLTAVKCVRMTSAECLARAQEAEAMAQVVSLGTDKVRLLSLAAAWRARAAEAAQREGEPEPPALRLLRRRPR